MERDNPFDRYDPNFNSNNKNKIIHQTWKTKDIPHQFLEYYESWSKLNPDYKHILWDDRDCYGFIQKYYSEFLDTYNRLSRPVERADLFRYLVVYHYGGVYADIDCECIKPISR